jgi:hypothetical protein
MNFENICTPIPSMPFHSMYMPEHINMYTDRSAPPTPTTKYTQLQFSLDIWKPHKMNV